MATRYSKIGAFPQIILLILLILLLVIGGLFWFDYLGLIDVQDRFAPALELVGIGSRTEIEDPDDIMLMDRMRLEALQEAVLLEISSLEDRANEIEQRRTELLEREQEMEERERELQEREVSLNERLRLYDNRRAVLEQNSRYLNSMRPAEAVRILEGYDDQLLIDTMRVTEELAQQSGEVSLVSVWLSSLAPERAADIQRKMTLRPDEQ